MAPPSASSEATLSATYKDPTTSRQFSYPQPTAASSASTSASTTSEKTAYLSGLRRSLVQMQGDVNAFLTQRMEDDKRAVAVDESRDGAKIDEQKEEDFYGEEADDEDG